ncbi:MAG: carboxypeptidase regulatory-like domain-containing protein, partial [Planctomycetes bacterium]|nr:carboxypeptidase regulatory-like domain-containing protein [Planctomycetota bacterium]
MEEKRWVVAGLLLAGLLGGAFWLFSRHEPGVVAPPTNASSQAPQAGAEVATADAAATTVPAGKETVIDEPARTAVAAPESARKTAILRGRCVDGDGGPLAGCTVRLHGWGANQERTDAWLLDHGSAPQWEDPDKVVTGADGRFELTFWPPPPFQFSLDVTRDGCVAMNGRWLALEEGSTTDVGDVVMAIGAQVSGRVVDTDGVPQAKAYVTIRRIGDPRHGAAFGAMQARWSSQAFSAADGSFRTHGWLVPGDYQVGVQERSLAKELEFELSAQRPVEDLVVVVKAAKEVLTISGRVVDETGQPVQGVRVTVSLPSRVHVSGGDTRRDGTFRLQLPEGGDSSPVGLVVWATDYETDAEPRVVPWGSEDVEFQITRGATLTVRIADQAGAPVETYSVRLIPRNRGRFSSDDTKVRAQGRHDNGTVAIEGCTRGDWLLMVDFPSASGLESLFESLQQTANVARRVDLRVGASVQRSLRVLGAGGAPIAGSKVQLWETFGSPMTEKRMAMSREQWLGNLGSHRPLVLFEGVTDASGRVSLQGPADRGLGLCLLGPGHLPLQRDGIRLDVAEEL